MKIMWFMNLLNLNIKDFFKPIKGCFLNKLKEFTYDR